MFKITAEEKRFILRRRNKISANEPKEFTDMNKKELLRYISRDLEEEEDWETPKGIHKWSERKIKDYIEEWFGPDY
jgi:hypothetical protein